MTVTEECVMYCPLCGGPIDNIYADEEIDWLSRAVLLHQAESARIIELPAENNGGPYFTIRSTGESVTACDYDVFADADMALYIPIHEACLTLTKRYILSMPANIADKRDSDRAEKASSGLEHLLRYFHASFDEFTRANPGCGPLTDIGLVNDYGEMWRFRELVWEPSNDPDRRFESQHFEADPLHIPDLTSSILEHVKPILASTPAFSGGATTSSSPVLPPEIIAQIVAELNPLSSPPLTCTYLLAPEIWKSAIVQGRLLPWLWDLDLEEAKKGGGWDWELLARQLAQVEIHEPGRVLPNLPMGLRNRRRIWRLIEDIMDTKIETN